MNEQETRYVPEVACVVCGKPIGEMDPVTLTGGWVARDDGPAHIECVPAAERPPEALTSDDAEQVHAERDEARAAFDAEQQAEIARLEAEQHEAVERMHAEQEAAVVREREQQ